MRSSHLVTLSLVLLLQAGQSVEIRSSPVQKVIELLDECTVKVQRDLDVDAKAMEEYASYCDDEVRAKTHAIKSFERQIQDLSATVADSQATIDNLASDIETLGRQIAEKNGELNSATTARANGNEVFKKAEKEMLDSVNELSGAVEMMKQGMGQGEAAPAAPADELSGSFLQGKGKAKAKRSTAAGKSAAHQSLQKAITAISAVVEAQGLLFDSRGELRSFLEKTKKTLADDDDDLSLPEEKKKELALTQQMERQPQGSASGETQIAMVEGLQQKAENTLSDLRRKEMQDQHAYELVRSGLNDEIAHNNDKLSTATEAKAATEQALQEANESTGVTQRSKAADEQYTATLKMECQGAAREWEERERSAHAELAAISKAKDILVGGVTAFAQLSIHDSRSHLSQVGDGGDATRQKLGEVLRGLAHRHRSFALGQLATMAVSDPFDKIRGLIEAMISKLMDEAAKAATHEAFCQEELGKSGKSKELKTVAANELKTKMDKAATAIAQLTDATRALEAEIAEVDSAQAEATELRNQEHADYVKAAKDYRDSAEAVARAIEVLKDYYNGAALLQLSSSRGEQRQPSFGGAQDDSAHGIISVLEMAQQDFTTLLAETEGQEEDAKKAYDKLAQENRIAKATKQTEVRGKTSEIKSVKVHLAHHTDDYQSVSAELESVQAYLNRLKPECETNVMSYGERKAARDAEITGLKDALGILASA